MQISEAAVASCCIILRMICKIYKKKKLTARGAKFLDLQGFMQTQRSQSFAFFAVKKL